MAVLGGVGIETLMGECVARAERLSASSAAIHAARTATVRKFGRDTTLGPREQMRARAYFDAVIRRRSVRRGQPARAAAHYVAAAVVEDLRAAGRDGRAIWAELDRGWRDSVPSDVLEEYRLRLCG